MYFYLSLRIQSPKPIPKSSGGLFSTWKLAKFKVTFPKTIQILLIRNISKADYLRSSQLNLIRVLLQYVFIAAHNSLLLLLGSHLLYLIGVLLQYVFIAAHNSLLLLLGSHLLYLNKHISIIC